MANIKKNTKIKANESLGFFEGIGETVKKDAEVLEDAFSDITSGRGKTASKLDMHASRFHGVTGNSFFKTALRTAVYGGGLLAAADFLNPFSLGWND